MLLTTHSPARHRNTWGLRLTTAALWAAAAASAVYWGLRLSAPAAPAPVAAASSLPPAPDSQAIARLLGAVPTTSANTPTPAAAPAASRFALVGVLAGKRSASGAALIAVDGQPAKPFQVGAAIDAGWVLLSLGPRQAQLGPAGGPASVTITLPERR